MTDDQPLQLEIKDKNYGLESVKTRLLDLMKWYTKTFHNKKFSSAICQIQCVDVLLNTSETKKNVNEYMRAILTCYHNELNSITCTICYTRLSSL